MNGNAISMGGGYDLIVRSQAEFERFVNDPDAFGVRSVLLVGLPDDSHYRLTGKGLRLPPALRRFDGVDRAAIEMVDFQYDSNSNRAIIWRPTRPTDDGYGIFHLTVHCLSSQAGQMIAGIINCGNMFDCYVNLAVTGATVQKVVGYGTCNRIFTCAATISNPGPLICGFENCIDLHGCYGIAGGGNGEANGFRSCSHLVNCYGGGTVAAGASAIAYSGGDSTVTRAGYGYYNCSYLSNCSLAHIGVSTALLGGTNTKVDTVTVAS